MSMSQTLLFFFLVILTTTFSGAFLLNEHANASVGHSDSGSYNIYSKIDALERSFQNLETTVREKTTHSDTLMRQVLLTVTEMYAKIEASDLRNMSLEIEEIKKNVENITGKSRNNVRKWFSTDICRALIFFLLSQLPRLFIYHINRNNLVKMFRTKILVLNKIKIEGNKTVITWLPLQWCFDLLTLLWRHNCFDCIMLWCHISIMASYRIW